MPITAWVSVAIAGVFVLWIVSLLLYGLYDKVAKRPMGGRATSYFDGMETAVKAIIGCLVVAVFLDVLI